MNDEQNKKDLLDFFGEDFEVTYDGEPHEKQIDAQTDGYKDVLSALSELDTTHSFDYLEANRTRTIDLDRYMEESGMLPKETEDETQKPWDKAISSCKRFFHNLTHNS